MAEPKPFRSLIGQLGRFSVTFVATVASALILLGWAVSWSGWGEASGGLAVVVAGAVLFEIWPLTVLRFPDPITIHLGQSFALAALYVWGVQPAMVVAGVSWFIGQAFARKQWWRTSFNAAQFVISMAAAGVAMSVLGGTPVGQGGVLVWSDLGWVVATWVVHLVVNDVLVSLLSESDGASFWQDLTDGLRWYLFSDLLADSLAIVMVVLVSAGSWYPLALIAPMVMFAMTYSLTRNAEHESLHDALTGVGNRRQLLQRLGEQVGRKTSYAVVLVDLDRFKQVNDRRGHVAGDAVLRATATRLGGAVRDTDLVARMGGDEFALVLGERPSDTEAIEVARRMFSEVTRPVPFGGVVLEVGVSIGVVNVARAEQLAVDEVLHRVDVAMYEAKSSGGGVVAWSVDLEDTDAERASKSS